MSGSRMFSPDSWLGRGMLNCRMNVLPPEEDSGPADQGGGDGSALLPPSANTGRSGRLAGADLPGDRDGGGGQARDCCCC